MDEKNSFKTWSKGFNAAPSAGGKTAGTFNQMGSIKIPNKNEPVYLYGFLVNVVGQATTAGESGFPIMRVNSSDVGLINEDYPLPELGFTDPIGTNSKSIAKPTQFVPVEVELPVNNKSFDIYFTSNATFTADWIGHVTAVFGNRPKNSVPTDYALEMMSGFKSFLSSLSRYVSDAAEAIAAANTEVSLTGLTIPSKAKQLTAVHPLLVVNAPTAAEEVCALFRFNAGDISDFQPQDYPSTVSYEPSLGTPVGGAQRLPARGYPVRFPLPGTEFTMSCTAQNVLALSNAPDLMQSVEFKTFETR